MPYDDSHPREAIHADARPGETRTEVRPIEREAPRREDDRKPADRKPDNDKADDGKSDRGDKAENPTGARRRPWLVWLILGIVLIAAIIGGVMWWLATKDFASTDDAFSDGRAIMIASQVDGTVTDLRITDNQRVKAGDVLLQIDQRDYVAARDQAAGQLVAAQGQLDAARASLDLARITYPAKLDAARAQVQSAQAQLGQADADFKRQTGVSRAATSQQNVDQATAAQKQAAAALAQAQANVAQAAPVTQQIAQSEAQVKQLEGQVATAQAQLDRANINLGHTTIVAPQDGWVTKRNVERGNYVTSGNSLMSLVSPEVWVTANFKESQLDRMRPGQTVDIAVDAYPGLKLKGRVDSVQLGSGSRFSAFPAENATGNYVKIVQRVPVKIDIDSGLDPSLPLPLGISVTPTVSLK